ncbi:DUF2852 domain-containing protein [Gellertiella hungarica]|uniref:DUF2852 domain-containing protein n=1 Tax=Gellertiella hungarica TaxID=1572859 RepID=A0A7W6J8S2_9HYPH|nr:DUF2852 domain-containing protein [Gellertiella hungarica]MBB4066870.1 hypothetical protein [Gellertiella hungarica]
MNQSSYIRPDWTPATVALMVLGFVVFWPLGLAMLAYILYGDRLQDFKREANRKMDAAPFRRWRGEWGRGSCRTRFHETGNTAFDEWRRTELDRLEAERRKLDEMRAEFDRYAAELRRAKDREEFDRFMRERSNRSEDRPADDSQGFYQS